MTLTSVVPVFVASLLLTGAAAQPASGSLSIGGLVVNSHNGEPLSRALVHIAGYSPKRTTAPSPPFASHAFTDAAGRFRFPALAGGSYSVWVERPHFVPEADGRREIELTASIEDLTLKLSPLGVITGKVVDQDGEPLRHIRVEALSTQIVDGLRQTKTDRNVATDDRGIYRFWNMQPGKYFIKAVGWSGGTYLYAGDAAPQFFADETYSPIYFGGGKSLDSATAIRIEAGTEAHADVAIKLEPAFKIRGSLTNFAPRRTVDFELLSGDEDVSTGRVSVNGDTGRFEVQYVASGSYILRATQDQARAEVPVIVSAADVVGVTVSLADAVDVKGAVRVTNRPDDPPSRDKAGRPIRAGCAVTLQPARGRSGHWHRSSAFGGDDFTIPGVMPGLYRVSSECFSAYVQTMNSGAQDLLANPMLTVPLVLDGKFDVRESMGLLFGGLGDPRTREIPFALVRANYDRLAAVLPHAGDEDYAAYLPIVGQAFCSQHHRDEVEAFFKERSAKTPGGPRILAQVLEGIVQCAATTSAQEASVAEFLRKY